ncbi:serine hydrolase [soil metagenome]
MRFSTLLMSLVALSVFGAATSHAQLSTGPLERRLSDACSLFGDHPSAYDSLFTASFKAQVSDAQLSAGLQQLSAICGPCTEVTITKRTSNLAASANARMKNGYVIPMTIAIEEAPPHRISSLFFRNPIREASSIDSLVAELKMLPGKTSLYIEKLGTGKPIIEHNGELMLPIGSTFKLYILGELARRLGNDSTTWATVTTLNPSLKSFPSGRLQDWPDGAPLTLHTLASLMISQSDNTATDHLLSFLGREQVERMQLAMGHSRPQLNKPFMSTREMFLLKFTDAGARARRYYALSEEQRRAMLRKELRSISQDDVSFVATPICADSVEWFASTHDLTKAMDWIRNAANSTAGKPLLGILAINHGIEIDEKQWVYAGFKGGSETGVINMTYLLKDVKGDWYSVSASWCNPAAPVDETKFATLIGTLLRMIPH